MKNNPSDAELAAALRFYENAPDGQYDREVAVPLIEAEIARRSVVRKGGSTRFVPREEWEIDAWRKCYPWTWRLRLWWRRITSGK